MLNHMYATFVASAGQTPACLEAHKNGRVRGLRRDSSCGKKRNALLKIGSGGGQ